MKKILFLCAILAISSILSAQVNPKIEIDALKAKYGSDSDFSADLNYQWFQDCESKPSEVMTGKIIKSHTNQYMKVGNVETINNARYSMVVDNEQKMVLIAKQGVSFAQTTTTLDWDKMSKMFTKMDVKQIDEQTRILTLATNYGTVNSYELVYNPTNYTLKKMTCYVTNTSSNSKCSTNKMVMEYLKTNFEAVDAAVFSEQKYITNSAKGLDLQSVYKGYQLINRVK